MKIIQIQTDKYGNEFAYVLENNKIYKLPIEDLTVKQETVPVFEEDEIEYEEEVKVPVRKTVKKAPIKKRVIEEDNQEELLPETIGKKMKPSIMPPQIRSVFLPPDQGGAVERRQV